ncbi:chemotaxis protein CheW [Sediminispirochaeta smaragdinae]|jgi:purine-binding chemotaxis protein CheW|uniref:Chemotaxis protein CheW n=1 Tax=Sediminispirochaeta smaragdinae (strain DSM 11293 / JCM 15392 / SEBR 4228) TaxID=573413 RepID=E1RAC1_SEDSS|nr:chemotaxis protein CheW [Sediminispirochaeta smaragdinae]ADK79412.1 CheW protein [Sediminispirochaeta smaragdinae DSM 11293]
MSDQVSGSGDVMIDEEDDIVANKYLLSKIGNELYGIDIRFVTDIIEMQKITEVPDMEEYVRGVINLRGQVIPVIDLRLRFGMAFREYDDRTCIIIVNVGESSIGFIVDTVSEVIDIPDGSIDPPPEYKSEGGSSRRFVSGLGKVGDSVKLLLDVEAIVSHTTST